jgi:hypothetical protein
VQGEIIKNKMIDIIFLKNKKTYFLEVYLKVLKFQTLTSLFFFKKSMNMK